MIDNSTDSQRALIFIIVTFLSTILSSMCSLIMMVIIFKLNREQVNTGMLKMIDWMSKFQLLYDATFFTTTNYLGSPLLQSFSYFLNMIGGIGSAVFSNYMAIVVFLSIRYRCFIDVTAMQYKMASFAGFLGIVVAMWYWVDNYQEFTHHFYYWVRIASIIVNFALCLWIVKMIKDFRAYGEQTPEEKALSLLAFRMFYYPLIQAISRSSVSWYEYVYGFDFNAADSASSGTSQFAGSICAMILGPCASYGYIIVFLVMQKKARKVFFSWFGWCDCSFNMPNTGEGSADTVHTSATRLDASSSHSTMSKYANMDDDTLITIVVEATKERRSVAGYRATQEGTPSAGTRTTEYSWSQSFSEGIDHFRSSFRLRMSFGNYFRRDSFATSESREQSQSDDRSTTSTKSSSLVSRPGSGSERGDSTRRVGGHDIEVDGSINSSDDTNNRRSWNSALNRNSLALNPVHHHHHHHQGVELGTVIEEDEDGHFRNTDVNGEEERKDVDPHP